MLCPLSDVEGGGPSGLRPGKLPSSFGLTLTTATNLGERIKGTRPVGGVALVTAIG